MKKLIVIITFFLQFYALQAQEDGLLWKISGNDLKKPSYLFGTIHAHCNPESIQKSSLKNAINSCETVALELDLSDMNSLIAYYKKSLVLSSSSLKSILTFSEYKSIDSACRVLLNDSLVNFDSKSPLAIYTSLACSEKFLNCKVYPIDLTILGMATKASKKIIGLESFGFQDSLLKSIPQILQVTLLTDFCTNLGKEKSDFQKVFDAYDSQKINLLYNALVETSPEMIYLKDAFLVQRNLNWVNFLTKNMATGSYFVAVGAGHLGGEEGLIALLKKAGYILTPIKF